MQIQNLNHVSIRSRNLEESRDFYVDILGLADGERPPFPFPGHWLYAGGQAVVHLIGVTKDDNSGLDGYLGGSGAGDANNSGNFDHVAFSVSGLQSVRDRLETKGLGFRERSVPLIGLHQIFIEDPSGITIELNFPEEENTGA